MDAINAGYDEITHINWVMMQAMPDSVIPVSNGIMRFEGPGRYAKDVNLEGPAIKTIIGAMASKHIYSDPTMVAFESLYVPENGDLSPSYAPFVGTLPPTTERSFRTGGFAVPKDLTRADYRASWAKMVGLLGRMHEAGVPIVAGTDGAGIELVHELEIYVQAGFSPAEALAAATIVPARLVGQDAKTGSVKVGKAADLALVDGDPSTRIGDLRQTRIVMLDGKLLDADALRSAAGFSGRPTQAPPPAPPLVRENATVKLSEHVWAIPDFNVGLVPNVGIIVGSKATLVVDTGLGPRNGEAIVREMKKVSTNADVYVVPDALSSGALARRRRVQRREAA